MGLSQALSTAMSGLRATQAAISLVGSNVANSETPGYVRKSVIQAAGVTGDYGSSVLLGGVDRQLDQYLQTQLRTETSGAAYADIRSTFLQNLQNVYGNPSETGTIEDSFNQLLTAFQGLSTSPDSQSARISAVSAAQGMAQTLNAATQGIQSLRANAEMGINDSVTTANNAMAQIAFINNQLQNNGKTDAATASLLDQRDQYITQLSSLMDIRTVVNNLNQVTVFTNSGVQLVGTEAAQLSFNPQGTMTPNTLYNSTDPSKSNVGTITINFPHGGSYDLVSTNSIRSGKIAAFLELREPGFDGTFGKAEVDPVHPFIRAAFKGPLVLNSDYRFDRAQAALDAGHADAITFGRTFLANPDLVERLRAGAALNDDVMATWYSQGAEGYIDYPALEGA